VESDELLDFVRKMKTTDHVILFYTNRNEKRNILFTYLKAGLDRGEAAAYITSQETPDQIRGAMKEFGIGVDRFEGSGALHVIDHKDWYFIDGKFSVPRTMELWKKLYNECIAKGAKGLRVTGEMAAFFDNQMVNELLEYERSLHRVLELPITAICAYDSDVVAKEGKGELFLDLIKAHSTVIFTGAKSGVVKSY
jgi:hypothetical protein